jgi:hypothetical protein
MSSYAKDFKGKSRNWFSKIQDANFEYITSMELGGILTKELSHQQKRNKSTG